MFDSKKIKNGMHLIMSVLILLSGYLIGANNERFESLNSDNSTSHEIEPKVTGIGGLFFKSTNPEQLKNWYGDNLGLAITDVGSPFEFRNAHRPDEINYLTWIPFIDSTDYFSPSKKAFMINYRVQNIEALIIKLRENNVQIVGEITQYPYGKFAHIVDPEGNKIELWEPNDSFFTQMGGPTTK
jgi:predicted enzyme related to lactoylglutathione lyase